MLGTDVVDDRQVFVHQVIHDKELVLLETFHHGGPHSVAAFRQSGILALIGLDGHGSDFDTNCVEPCFDGASGVALSASVGAVDNQTSAGLALMVNVLHERIDLFLEVMELGMVVIHLEPFGRPFEPRHFEPLFLLPALAGGALRLLRSL